MVHNSSYSQYIVPSNNWAALEHSDALPLAILYSLIYVASVHATTKYAFCGYHGIAMDRFIRKDDFGN